MSPILETWDLASNSISLGYKIQNFREYLQAELKNDECFYKDVVIKFVLKIYGMTKLKRKEEDFPSLTCVKQLKSCWIKRIKTLKELLDDLDVLSVKKGEAYLKLVELDLAGTTGEVEYPKLISNYILMTRKQLEEHVEILKGILLEKFNNMTYYSKICLTIAILHRGSFSISLCKLIIPF